tara:strand:+ start:178 stop:486 length:309 start_codon:yes stop_codon:yes gene_type:complete
MDKANEIERCLDKVQEYRHDAFLLAGVAYFNYNRVPLLRQMDKYKNEEILGVAKRLKKLTGVEVARIAHILVNDNPTLANALSTIIGFELEDRQRREDADEV